MAGTVVKKLNDAESRTVFCAANKGAAEAEHSLDGMHPAAREAREKDLRLHPEKIPHFIKADEKRHLYEYKPANQTRSGTELEALSPDCAALKIPPDTYCFVDPETGKILNSVHHNTSCLLYTNADLQNGGIIRVKAEST